MFKITNNKMYLTRGDTAQFSIGLVHIPGVSSDYELSDDDQVYFIVTEKPQIIDIDSLNSEDADYVFYKEGINIQIDPEDTESLSRDIYFYQVRVLLNIGGSINTIIEPTEFYITPVEKVLW